MSLIFRNLGKIPEETAHVLQYLVSAKAVINIGNGMLRSKTEMISG